MSLWTSSDTARLNLQPNTLRSSNFTVSKRWHEPHPPESTWIHLNPPESSWIHLNPPESCSFVTQSESSSRIWGRFYRRRTMNYFSGQNLQRRGCFSSFQLVFDRISLKNHVIDRQVHHSNNNWSIKEVTKTPPPALETFMRSCFWTRASITARSIPTHLPIHVIDF